MLLSLEVLKAKHGDCLILHYGKGNHHRIIVIDGGPGGVYGPFLRPRLLELKNDISPDDPLPLSMVMVSHLDDDHVNGILQLLAEVRSDLEDGTSPTFNIENLWFNTFDDIVGNLQIPIISGIQAAASEANLGLLAPELADLEHDRAAVIASTGQGRRLRNDARAINANVNNPFDELAHGKANLIRSEDANSVVTWDDGLKITVVHPTKKRLTELQEQWDKDLKKAFESGDHSIIFASIAGSRDTSVFNLTSIVCLVAFHGKTILLTGDARDDDILQGLKSQNLLDANGKIHVDILKVPHHGSDRNASRDFFERVTADHYVISGDGKHHNPEKSTLVMLEEGTLGRDNFTIHFTYHEGEFDLKKKLDQFASEKKSHGRTFKINFMEANSHSIILNLLDDI